MDIVKTFFDCLGGCGDYTASSVNHFDARSGRDLSGQDAADKILNLLFKIKMIDGSLEKSLKDIEYEAGIRNYGWDWRQNVYISIFNGLQNAIEKGAPMGEVMKEAFLKATNAAVEFVKDNPQYCAIIAIGILVIMAPWILEAVGFGMEGPIAGRLLKIISVISHLLT